MKNIIREIKYAYQRVRYGYDSRLKWDFADYFSQFIPPLKEFCEEELKELKNCADNEKRKEIYQTTLDLIYDFEFPPDGSFYKEHKEENKMWTYIGARLSWYWN